MSTSYKVQAFADLAGVTVRALHHYDRLALLRPARTRAGYRLYGPRDLERLEKIVALKCVGVPLKQIKTVIDRDARALPDVLRAQRRALEAKRRRLDRAIGAIAMEGTRKWQALFADVTASLEEDPASPKAQQLLDRWRALIDEFTGGSQAIEEGLGRAWGDRDNWNAGMKQNAAPFSDPRVWDFISRCRRAAP